MPKELVGQHVHVVAVVPYGEAARFVVASAMSIQALSPPCLLANGAILHCFTE